MSTSDDARWDAPPTDPLDDIRRSVTLTTTPFDRAASAAVFARFAERTGNLVEVELADTSPEAVAVTRTAVETLFMGFLLDRDGKFYVSRTNAAFCQIKGWAKPVYREPK